MSYPGIDLWVKTGVIRPSKTGVVLAALYTIAAAFLFHDAMTCTGMLCDLVAFPVFVPAGYIYWLPFSGQLNYIPDPMRKWEFVIPTAVTNVVFYYFLGHAVGGASGKSFKLPVSQRLK